MYQVGGFTLSGLLVKAAVTGAVLPPPPRYKHAFVYIAHSLIFIGFRYLTLSEGVGHVLIEIKRL